MNKQLKKISGKILLPSILMLALAAAIAIPASAASTVKVELGTTSSFAVLAGSEITNTGTTTISGDAGGDVGLYAGTSFGATGVTMTGTAYLSDGSGVASQAQTDLTAAYTDAAGRTPTTAIVADLGGTTLKSGVYNSGSSIGITGTLTLDAEGDPEAVFIFQAGSTLVTASNSEIKLINGARYCRVFWQVGSSANLGTNSVFVGHIFALTSITAETGATIQGQLLAQNGAVTLDNNTITNGFCAAAEVTPSPTPDSTPTPTTPGYTSIIQITKTPDPLTLPSSGGSVTYTYTITNLGTSPLSTVSITDDKISDVNYTSGDDNNDSLLQSGETWIYTAVATLNETTTNTAVVSASTGGKTVTDTTTVTVIVPPPVVTTVTGGELPNTSTPWYTVLVIGVGLTILGLAGFAVYRIEKRSK